jgi:hypothetical protein
MDNTKHFIYVIVFLHAVVTDVAESLIWLNQKISLQSKNKEKSSERIAFVLYF